MSQRWLFSEPLVLTWGSPTHFLVLGLVQFAFLTLLPLLASQTLHCLTTDIIVGTLQEHDNLL